MTLLREIQQNLASAGGDVATVLRKCKILAARLGSKEFAQWVDWELNGYPENQPTPEYRRLAITYYASFVSVAWRVNLAAVPIQIVPEEYRNSFVHIEFREGITKAESLARGNAGGTKRIAIERPELIYVIQGKMYPEMACTGVWGELARNDFEQLVSAVKTRILDFSLKIETENPAAGEAMPNTQPVPKEKLTHIVQNIFYGSVGAVAQNSENFTQTANIVVPLADLEKLVSEFTNHLHELNLEERQRQRAEAQLATMKTELAGVPDDSIVKNAARTLRNITEGAIAGLLATAAQPTVWIWVQRTLESLSR